VLRNILERKNKIPQAQLVFIYCMQGYMFRTF